MKKYNGVTRSLVKNWY